MNWVICVVNLQRKKTPHFLPKKSLNRKRCKHVVVSLGAKGAILVNEMTTVHFIPPAVKLLSTVGAGDSMVAGILFKLVSNAAMIDAVRFGVACGTAATLNTGTELCHLADAQILFDSMENQNKLHSTLLED